MAKSKKSKVEDLSAVSTDKSTGASPEIAGEAPFDSERVAQRAYELYLSRGGGDGQDLEDWLIAEREMRHQPSGRDKQKA